MIIASREAMGIMGGIDYVISPISVPLTSTTLKIHVAKGAYLCHVTKDLPIIFDVQGVIDNLISVLFTMQSTGCKNNVLIIDDKDRRTVADNMLVWQMFGGIALPLIGYLQTTLRTVDDIVTTKALGQSGEVSISTLSEYFDKERSERCTV
jgi:hypothetical protein